MMHSQENYSLHIIFISVITVRREFGFKSYGFLFASMY